MKKFVIIITLLLSTSSFTTQPASIKISTQVEKYFNGYVYHQGNPRAIRLIALQTQYGWKLTKYEMSDPIVQDYTGNRVEAAFVPLNPNNSMAVKYNFTHYVSTPQGYAYTNVYQ